MESNNVLYLGKISYMKFYVALEEDGISMYGDNQSFSLRAIDRKAKIKSWSDFRNYFIVSAYHIYKLDKGGLEQMLTHLNGVLNETIEEFLAKDMGFQHCEDFYPNNIRWHKNDRHCEIKTLYRIINENWKGYWLKHEEY